MAYQLFKRTKVRVSEPAISLVPDGRIALNAAAVRILVQAKVSSVVLLWDADNTKVAVKAASKGDMNAYAVTFAPDRHSGSLRARSFITHIGWSAAKRELLPAAWNEQEKMFEISVPAQYLASASHAAQPKRGEGGGER